MKRKSSTDTFDTLRNIINKNVKSSFSSQSSSKPIVGNCNGKHLIDNYTHDIENNINNNENGHNDINNYIGDVKYEDYSSWRNYHKKLSKFQKNNCMFESQKKKSCNNGVFDDRNNIKKIENTGNDHIKAVYDQSKHIYGTLIIDIIDSGVGMALEESNRLFKEIVQFNPGELQVNKTI